MPVLHHNSEAVSVWHGDCLDVLRELPDCSVDAIVTDPPYGLSDLRPSQVTAAITAWAAGDRERVPDARGFMGRSWDAFVPPPAVWDECLRVLKPGGHLAAFTGSRTYDLMGIAIRMAGFEIRDGLMWQYASGMPKGLDVSKAIDKARDDRGDVRHVCRWLRARIDEHPTVTVKTIAAEFGVHSRMVDHWAARDTDSQPSLPTPEQWVRLGLILGFGHEMDDEVDRLNVRKGTWGHERADRVTTPVRREVYGTGSRDVEHAGTPVLDDAARWSGWNTALKPAHEPIVLARKPLVGTVAGNVLAHGVGGINIDGCRVSMSDADRDAARVPQRSTHGYANLGDGEGRNGERFQPAAGGRFPANVILSHTETCDESECDEGCPVAELDQQSGTTPSNARADKGRGMGYHGADGERGAWTGGDSGGASRFFPTFRYQAKAPKSERPKVDGVAHPTCKPLAVMAWLARLLCPPGGTVLEPFAGSGTTIEACLDEGFRVIGVEREGDYLPLIDVRVQRATQRATARTAEAGPAGLFDLDTAA